MCPGSESGGVLAREGHEQQAQAPLVVPAQLLRAEAALLIEWLRLSLHGFIGSWKKRNENGPVIVADRGRRAKIMRARAKRALRFPDGPQAVLLGLAKPPPDPKPDPPPAPAAV